MFVPLPDGIRITFVFTLAGKEVTITIYVTTPDPIDASVLDDALNVAYLWWGVSMRPLVSAGLVLSHIRATDVSVEDGVQRELLCVADCAGTVAGDVLPSSVAAVVSIRTSRIGRSYRGRNYIPGIAETSTTGNLINAGLAGSFVAAYNTLRTNLATAGYTMVVASYFNNGVPRVTAHAEPVTHFLCNQRVDTQRRRL